MHIPTPAEIRAMREKFSLTQAELAGRAGISQSMIARIEAGSVDPRVSTLQRIVSVLNVAERSVITAAQVMHTPVIGVGPGDPITRAVDLMGQNGVSQLPVLSDGVPVGCISEAALLTALEEQQLHRTHPYLVQEFMEPSFPTVPPEMDVETILHILQQHHAVLVAEAGRVQGVITKHDLISLIV
jgi:predicted transcriptional regulator